MAMALSRAVIVLDNHNGFLLYPQQIQLRDAAAEMPGKKRLRSDMSLWFEPSHGNIEFLRARFPDAVWNDPARRLSEIGTIIAVLPVWHRRATRKAVRWARVVTSSGRVNAAWAGRRVLPVPVA